MRLGPGAVLTLFNGQDGEWDAEVALADKKGGALVCRTLTRPQGSPPDLWLMFAPVKKARTDFIVEKAVEMGAARIMPVLTDYTNAERVRGDRMAAHIREAAEQCGISYLPDVTEPEKLARVLDHWPDGRRLMFCDETRLGAATSLATEPRQPWAILIGPEGGFSGGERERLAGLPYALPVSLGPRILRADTAAVAALALWQAALGDWA